MHICTADMSTMWCSYKKLPVDVQPGSQILCADGSIVLEVLKCNPDQGTVRCRCTNNATLGYDLLSLSFAYQKLFRCPSHVAWHWAGLRLGV